MKIVLISFFTGLDIKLTWSTILPSSFGKYSVISAFKKLTSKNRVNNIFITIVLKNR